MQFYFAPLEGITGCTFRKIHQECFSGIHKYFAPFIATKSEQRITWKDLKDVMPEQNKGVPLIPQILTNKSKDCLEMIKMLNELGYEEVNLNFGCPSKTVVTKNKGSGILKDTEHLNRFLYEVLTETETAVSVKTRTGLTSHEEMYHLLEIYNQYEIEELIVHPRVQADYYKNKPNLDIFRMVYEESRNPVCYNGDVFSIEDLHTVRKLFPNVNQVMLGRGLLMNPGLVTEIERQGGTDKSSIKRFHDKIYGSYQEILYGDKALLFKMKELWAYMIQCFPGQEKMLKKIRKAERRPPYEEAVSVIFESIYKK